MKVALAIPFKNEEDILGFTMPKVPKDMFSDFVFLDTGSTDGSREIIKSIFGDVTFYDGRTPFFDHGFWRQTMLDTSRKLGCDWCFMLDTDETIFRREYEIAFKYMEHGESDLYRMARINLVGSDKRFAQELYPDWQARIMRCATDFHYLHGTHAQPCYGGGDKIVRGHFLPDVRIFHYGWTRSNERFTLKELNYRLWDQGKPGLEKLPEGQEIYKQIIDSQPYLGELP